MLVTVKRPAGDGCDGDAALERVVVVGAEGHGGDVSPVAPPPDRYPGCVNVRER
jgi:hypothetical protein